MILQILLTPCSISSMNEPTNKGTKAQERALKLENSRLYLREAEELLEKALPADGDEGMAHIKDALQSIENALGCIAY